LIDIASELYSKQGRRLGCGFAKLEEGTSTTLLAQIDEGFKMTSPTPQWNLFKVALDTCSWTLRKWLNFAVLV